jgi:hypothetical protein
LIENSLVCSKGKKIKFNEFIDNYLSILHCTAPTCWTQSNNERCSFFMVKFNTEDKLEAIQRYLQGNDSYHTIGDSIGATHYTIMNWVKQ